MGARLSSGDPKNILNTFDHWEQVGSKLGVRGASWSELGASWSKGSELGARGASWIEGSELGVSWSEVGASWSEGSELE